MNARPYQSPCLRDSLWSGLALPSAGLVALVGGGGKTSLMYRLAAEAASRGIAVICTTTTRIFPPRIPEDANALVLAVELPELTEHLRRAPSPCVLANALDTNKPAANSMHKPTDKLMGLPPETLDALAHALPDRLFLVEADGAAMRPLKAPAPHEPAFPTATVLAIAVIGLEALGRPIHPDHVHRPERVLALTDLLPAAPVNIAAIRILVEHQQGLFQHCPPAARRIVFGNKADAAPPPKDWPWLYGSAQQGWCADGRDTRGAP